MTKTMLVRACLCLSLFDKISGENSSRKQKIRIFGSANPSIHPSIVLFQATRPMQKISTENNDRQKHRKHQRRKEKKTQNTQWNNQDKMHNYTARSALTKALLHVFHLATSDFLALFISVSKLGRPVKSSILVTL